MNNPNIEVHASDSTERRITAERFARAVDIYNARQTELGTGIVAKYEIYDNPTDAEPPITAEPYPKDEVYTRLTLPRANGNTLLHQIFDIVDVLLEEEHRS